MRVRMPFGLRAERTPDQPLVQSLMYGPINLVARDARRALLELGLCGRAALSGDLAGNLQPVAGSPLHFRLGEVTLAPRARGRVDIPRRGVGGGAVHVQERVPGPRDRRGAAVGRRGPDVCR